MNKLVGRGGAIDVDEFTRLLRNSPGIPMNFAPNRTFTHLEARITEEEDEFTVSVQMKNGEKKNDTMWGVDKAGSLEIASGMIAQLARQFSIPEASISLSVKMNNYRAGTFH